MHTNNAKQSFKSNEIKHIKTIQKQYIYINIIHNQTHANTNCTYKLVIKTIQHAKQINNNNNIYI